MKKPICVLLVLLLVMQTGICVCAEEEPQETYTSGDYEYSLLEDGTVEIVKYKGRDQELSIPEQLDGNTVTAIGDEAFIWNYNLASVKIPDSVTFIGDRAFAWCDSLTSVTIPDSVASIDGNPFLDCVSLMSIHISPDHPTLDIIDGVLFSKPDKRLVYYPRALDAESYSIPNGIKIIGDGAFYRCEQLTSITLTDSVTSIGDSAFFECSSLTSVTIPESVTSIGDYAFGCCPSLTSITIPDSVISIGMNPLLACIGLMSIRVSPDHPTLETMDGVLFSKPDKKLVYYPYTLDAESYSIPDGIEIIGDWAFSDGTNLTSITIPNSVTSIGDNAFNFCQGLTSVTIPDSVTSIGEGAFKDCKKLTATVGSDSYAKQYCIDNDINYTYPDSND